MGRSQPVLRPGGRQHGRRRATTCGKRPRSPAGTCVPGRHHTVRGSELGAAVEAGRVVRRPARLNLGEAPPSSLPLSSACSPGGEGALTSASKPARSLVPALPLTSCVTLGSYITTSFLHLLMYKMKIIIALPCIAVVRREDARIMCLAHRGPLDVHSSCCYGC